jgi:hypothetical protein
MKIAFVTPSYRGDLERCRLLCESTTRFLPAGVEHLLLVDRRDVPLFRPLENRTVRVVVGESLLPWWIFRPPGVRRWWASLATPPIRNWIYQQLLKIAAYRATDADVLQYVDSDVTLIRPFPADYLVRDGRVRFQRVRYQSEGHRRWLRTAGRVLGVDLSAVEPVNYVGSFITWRRSNVLAMLDRIRQVTGKSWVRALGGCLHLSEYMTHGVFVDHVLGPEAAGVFRDDSPNLALCWDYDVRTEAGMDRFFADIAPAHFGVMIHSKFGIPVERYRARIARLWDAA